MIEIAKLLAGVGTPLAAGALAAEVITSEQIRFVVLLAGVVVAVVAALGWNRRQMRDVVTAHAKEDIQRYNAVLRELVLMNHTLTGISTSLGLPTPAPIRAEFEELEERRHG